MISLDLQHRERERETVYGWWSHLTVNMRRCYFYAKYAIKLQKKNLGMKKKLPKRLQQAFPPSVSYTSPPVCVCVCVSVRECVVCDLSC